MVTKRDYYKILMVATTATMDEIKKAYRQLSKKYHPDLNPDMKLYSDDKMKELVEAYNVLSDNDKRLEYDSQPHFQIRKTRKDKYNIPMAGGTDYTKKPKYQREASMIERFFSPFIKKKSEPTGTIQDPKQADVHFTLGLSMSENTAFYDQAIDEFKLALKFYPEFPEALYNLGIICYRKGYYEEAVVAFQKVLALNKNDQYAYKLINLLREEY